MSEIFCNLKKLNSQFIDQQNVAKKWLPVEIDFFI